MKRPNWNEWKHIPDVTVWQACALSMDIDPHSMVPHRRLIGTSSGAVRPMEKDAVGPSLEPYDFSSADAQAEFERRQRTLRMHLSNRTFFSPGVLNQIQPDNSLVRLSEFASWAQSVVMWDGLPVELVEMASTLPKTEESPASKIPEKRLTTTERNTLLVIIAALCDYSAIKYQDRGAAGQIAKMTEEIGAPVTDDTIRTALAKIPDALETRMK
ncbi:hypothetical protein [Accumulibacter sp.]|uniref:hypothetical protein n=1 Tax=Accumulibacter sp. TaxID=2053492 RepID=UPI00262535BD|nr:hypothetical protein [Accumulibacter sp.]